MEGWLMSNPLIEEDDASTPLTEEEREELLPSYISIRSELNEVRTAQYIEGRRVGIQKRARCLIRTLSERTA